MVALKLFACILSSFVFAEFVGYVLHRLLHSHRIQFLSRNHMIHHLRIYGPKMPKQPAREYRIATGDRTTILGIGMEWIVPSGILYAVLLTAFWALNWSWPYQVTFLVCASAWSSFMFEYMHRKIHVKDFWMETSPLLSKWFARIRHLHNVHHMDLDNSGTMTKNFGICWFGYDRIFGTFAPKHQAFNDLGFENAQKLYAFVDDG